MPNLSLRFSLLGLAVAGFTSALFAQGPTWNDNGTDWNTASNWTGGLPSATDDPLFNTTSGQQQPNLSASTTVAGLTFNSTGWDLTGSSGTVLTLAGNSSSDINVTGSGTVTIDANLNFSTTGTAGISTSSASLILNGVVSSSAATTLTIGGNVSLNGANTYTGTTRWDAASTVSLGNAQAFGASTVVFQNASTLTLVATTDLTGTNKIENALLLSQNVTFQNDPGHNLEFGGNVLLTTSGRTLFATAGTTTFDGVISATSGYGLTFNTSSGASFVLNGASTFTNPAAIVGAGVVSVSSIGNAGVAGNLGEGRINLGSLATGGILNYTGAGEATNRTISLAGTTGGGEIDANGTGAITFSVIAVGGSGTKTFTLGGASTAANTISGIIADKTASNTTAVTKAGAGTWNLTAANTFTGGLKVTAGTLDIGNAGALGGGAVTINGGSLVLTTGATGSGTFTLNSGGDLSLGANTLSLGSNTLALAGGSLHLTLGTTFGEIAGTGTLSFTGGTLVLNTGGSGFDYHDSYQVLHGYDTSGLSALSITGYDTADWTAHLDNAGDLTFTGNSLSAVPEPSSYALIFGASALGFAAYRRRRVAA